MLSLFLKLVLIILYIGEWHVNTKMFWQKKKLLEISRSTGHRSPPTAVQAGQLRTGTGSHPSTSASATQADQGFMPFVVLTVGPPGPKAIPLIKELSVGLADAPGNQKLAATFNKEYPNSVQKGTVVQPPGYNDINDPGMTIDKMFYFFSFILSVFHIVIAVFNASSIFCCTCL